MDHKHGDSHGHHDHSAHDHGAHDHGALGHSQTGAAPGKAIDPVSGILLSPMIAAAAMSLASVLVIANALRLKRARLQAPQAMPGSDFTCPALPPSGLSDAAISAAGRQYLSMPNQH